MTLDKSATPTSSRNSATRRAASASRSSRPRSTAPAPISSRGRTPTAKPADPLRALGDQGRRRRAGRRRSWRRGAGGPFAGSWRFRRADFRRAISTSACSKASLRPAPSMSSSPTARASSPRSSRSWRLAHRREEERRAGQAGALRCRASRSARRRQGRELAAGRAAAARIRRRRLLPFRPSARCLCRRACSGCACGAGPISPAR